MAMNDMYLCLHAVVVANSEVTGRDPRIIGPAPRAATAYQVRHRLKWAVLSPVRGMPSDGRRRSVRIRTVATAVDVTRIPP